MKMKKSIRRRRSAAPAHIEAVERRTMLSTYTVNTLSDALHPPTGQLSLRQAVADADAHSGADTIAFSSSVFSPNNLHTITLENGPISFTDKSGLTTVTGPGSAILAISGNEESRVLQISSGVNVSISGLAITHGMVNTSAGVTATGGGVENAGTLSLNGVTVSDDTVTSQNQTNGIRGNGGSAFGGGIDSVGTLSITNSNVSGNTAAGGNSYYPGGTTGAAFGGGIFTTGDFTISNSVVSGNTARAASTYYNGNTGGAAYGGGIDATHSFSVNSTTISNNFAGGGSNYTRGGGGAQGGSAFGGGIFTSAAANITGSTFENDECYAGRDGSGGGETIGLATAWGGAIDTTATLEIASSTFSGNQATGGGEPIDDNGFGGNTYGGAIASDSALTVTATVLNDNTALGGYGSENAEGPGSPLYCTGLGGGIYSSKTLLLVSSTLSGNTAEGEQNEDMYGGGGGYGRGGGVFLQGAAKIEASTFAGNIALGGIGTGAGESSKAGTGGAGEGAGVFDDGTLTLVESTLTGNNAEGGIGGDGSPSIGGNGSPGNGGDGEGAGIYSDGTLTIQDSTVSGNSTVGGAAGPGYDVPARGSPGTGLAAGVAIASGKAVFSNSIISGNIANTSTSDDISGTANPASSHNLIGIGGGLINGVNGNKIDITNPKLAALGNYGGPMQTMPPLAGSPAIGGGSVSLLPAGITTDQRGFPRSAGSSVDIGSVEYGNASISGSIFNDTNANGTRNSGEPALAGWTLFLDLNVDGLPDNGEPTAITNSSGDFTFSNLPAGKYRIWQDIPVGYRCDSPSAFFYDVTVAAGQASTGIVFADTQKISLNGSVFNDANDNGKQDTHEAALADWRVYVDLTNSEKYVASDPSIVTTSTGQWSFTTLAAGTYIIRVVPESGWKTTTPLLGYFKFIVGAGGIRVDNVFGEFK